MASWIGRLQHWLAGGFQLPPVIATDLAQFIVLDIETTGLEARAEPLAIGAIRMIGSRILVGQTFEQFIRPTQTNWSTSTPVHRILPADVADAPSITEALAGFATFCAKAILVGHQVAMDRTFLTRPNHPQANHIANQLWFDTQRAAKWLGHSQTSLTALAEHYQIPLPRRHHALTDAFVTAQIWQRQLYQFKARGLDTLPALAKIVQI